MYGMEDDLQDLRAEVKLLKSERLRFYHADGTFEMMDSPEEVTKRRVECAQRITNLETILRRAHEFVPRGTDVDRECLHYLTQR